jgi:hypothetical protein
MRKKLIHDILGISSLLFIFSVIAIILPHYKLQDFLLVCRSSQELTKYGKRKTRSKRFSWERANMFLIFLNIAVKSKILNHKFF